MEEKMFRTEDGICQIMPDKLIITDNNQKYTLKGLLMFLPFSNKFIGSIDRNKIERIRFTYGYPGFTRPRFDIFFKDAFGKQKRCRIHMPGELDAAINEAEKAFDLMKNESLI